MLELLGRGRRVAKAQLQLPSRCGRPHHMQAHVEIAAECQRLVGARSTILLSSAARLEPREPRQSEHELRPLAALARQLDRLFDRSIRRVAQRSVVAWSRAIRFSTNGSAPTAARARAVRNACSSSEAPGAGLAQEDRPDRRPQQQQQVVLKLGGALGERNRLVDRLGAGRGIAAEDAGHPDCDRSQEARADRRVLRQPCSSLAARPTTSLAAARRRSRHQRRRRALRRRAQDRRARQPRSGSHGHASPARGAPRCGRRADRFRPVCPGRWWIARASSSSGDGAIGHPGKPTRVGCLP